MLYVYTVRFDVMENLKNFTIFVLELDKAFG